MSINTQEIDLSAGPAENIIDEFLNIKNKDDVILEYTAPEQFKTDITTLEEHSITHVAEECNNDNICQETIPSITETLTKFNNDILETSGKKGASDIYLEENKYNIDEELLVIKSSLEKLSMKNDDNSKESLISDLMKMHNNISSQRKSKIESIKNKMFKETQDSGQENIREALPLPNIRFSINEIEDFLKLEKRIADLEKNLGPKDKLPERSITSSVNSLYTRLKIISASSDELNEFHMKLQEISTEYEDSLLGKQSRINNTIKGFSKERVIDLETKVSELYKSNSILENYAEGISKLSSRIRHISQIDTNIKYSVDSLNEINQTLSELHDRSSQWEILLQKVEDGLLKQEIGTRKNLDQVGSRLTALENSLQGLKKDITTN
ncbi:hypothetical protein TPHA_0L02220 [Tetrapisispora phaffii CBS 4417]|uniref:Uncharacterized protein n=1 Tax=Tetrapisispora phaffii (strain ATCC 24235 / CBS 4417 / NBRC 1672 / NRRL Y-8282 / UCD 70-5) TaxID=1071381 RepID=G8C095_TETPH|nr:hypothetical protein TPHA_0L02220 [Tetrapisispora phaffii CBS 4417]CCE65573.1 hypothetical protein TPHA_0L02220 [Tetrapisispora phaffii CBS 4417]